MTGTSVNESFRDGFYFTFINSIEKGWQLLLLCDNTLVFEMVVSGVFLFYFLVATG